MTYIVNNPKHFAADSLKGMVAANSEYLIPVHGGVVRATASPEGEVSVVVGGGSGHYPAFAGWVGPGMAHGAVCGNIFASPSASQVESVVRACDNGGGVLLLFGNYAGDCLHFGAACKNLVKAGIDTRIVTISDDIASNSIDKADDRRGIAGDIFVVKAACAAAAQGLPLSEVERITDKANAHTHSLGVAFTGCTLPGAKEPLFTVPEGKYALGLGIHGEPGIALHPMGTAQEIAELLTQRVLAEEPERSVGGYEGRIAVLLNGLGATKYEELYVLFASVADLLKEHGLEMVKPIVGEQVTSLDMAGVSLSIMFLDSELEQLYLSPAASPAFISGTITKAPLRVVDDDERTERIQPGSSDSAAQAKCALSFLKTMADEMSDREDELGKLDSIAGDGDHGQGMVLGSSAAFSEAQKAVETGAGIATMFTIAGAAWADGAGGTSGAAWGNAISAFGKELSDARAASAQELGNAAVTAALAFESVGSAQPGDKTMVDATHPFAESLKACLDNGLPLPQAWLIAASSARDGASATVDMVAKKGRARTHGTASIGHEDPGAVSFAMLMNAIAIRLSQ